VDERRERMAEIARDAWFVASTESPFPGMTRWQSVVAAMATANVETNFALDVDTFRCVPPRADHCHAVGLLQAHPFTDEERDLVRTRRGALIVGWRRMRSSLLLCAGDAAFHPFLGKQCDDATGLPGSRKRLAEIATWREYAGRLGAP
jgi:hypothetical protein